MEDQRGKGKSVRRFMYLVLELFHHALGKTVHVDGLHRVHSMVLLQTKEAENICDKKRETGPARGSRFNGGETIDICSKKLNKLKNRRDKKREPRGPRS